MKKILLAVDGIVFDKKALNYALTLCNPVRAGLDVLQIIRPLGGPEGFSRLKNKVRRVRDAFENAMVQAVYAEAGVPLQAGPREREAANKFKSLIPPDMASQVDYHCVITGEDPDAMIARYVDEHRNIVMAIYDTVRAGGKAAAEAAARGTMFSNPLNRLHIPLVFVRDL